MITETRLAQTIIATMRELGPAPESDRPEILVNVKDLEAVIEEHLDEYLARDRDETPPPQTHVRVSRSTSALVEQAGEILANYGLIPHAWDEAGCEAREVAISEIIVLARTPSPETREVG